MSDDSTKNGLVKVASTSIVRYSNALVRRGIEELNAKIPNLIRSVIPKWNVLFIVNDDTFSVFLRSEVFNHVRFRKANEDVAFQIIETSPGHDNVYSEIAVNPIDLVVFTNMGIPAKEIPTLVSEVRLRCPNTILFVLSAYDNEDFVASLYRAGIDAFFKLPFDIEELVDRIWLRLNGIILSGRINLLLPFYLHDGFSDLFDTMGFRTLWSHDQNSLEELARANEIDVAIEWLRYYKDFPIRDLLGKIGKNPPIFLALNYGERTKELLDGYTDTLVVPFDVQEMKEKFVRVLPPVKKAIFERWIQFDE